jgi:hypothetical protein
VTGAPAAAFSWPQVCARRMERHSLATPSENGRPADVVRAMCGAHAQVMAAAELSVGIRTVGTSRADVRRALWDERSLVKTFGPRGTVHLLAAEDLPLWTGALGAVPPAATARGGFLTLEQTDEIVAVIADALGAGELTGDELNDAVAARTGPWAGDLVVPAFKGLWPRWRAAIAAAGFRGLLCLGPGRGRLVTYTSPERILPGFRPADATSALGWLVRAYLHAYGPATPAQFAQWLGAPRPWAGELFDSLATELMPVTVEGMSCWVTGRDTQQIMAGPSGIRLLPYFDPYIVGCHPRDLLFPGQAAKRALARGQTGNFPVMLVDGVVGGLWHQRRSGRRIEITAEPFRRLTPPQAKELAAQAERIGDFLESASRLTLDAIRTGGHS